VKLVCIEGSAKDSVWELTGKRLVIGRDTECDINLDDSGLSRNHAEIIREGENLVFVDRGSLNGSLINGHRVTRRVLVAGDRIKIGDNTIQVVGNNLNQPLYWEENDPFVTTAISVDHFRSQLKELVSGPRKTNRRTPGRDSTERLKIVKLTKNLETLYRAGNAINSIQNLDEMLDQIAETILAVYQDVERVCILLKIKKGGSRFEPKIIKTRHDVPSETFRLSRSILSKAVREEVCVLAGDANSDERFLCSQSVMSMKIRSVMCAPLISKGSVLGVVYLDNRKAPDRFDEDDLALLSALANQSAVAIENSLLYEEVQKGYHEAILALMNTVDVKDSYTRGHSQRTSRYALGIAHEMGLSDMDCEKIKIAAELHDIGKIGVGDLILGKQGTLSTMEFNTIQAHVLAGENIVRPIRYLRFALPMIRHHHEHYDGTGYPDRLKGDQIPLGARIIGAADTFDAMTTQRPYNKPSSFKDALKKCVALKGKQFDPDVIDALGCFVDKALRNGLAEGTSNQQGKFPEIRLAG
jgi:HD-GYP domain-containing protein (c-di-GMP phosphodiesterase class II)